MTIAEKAKAYQAFYRDKILSDVAPFWVKSDLLDEEFGGAITSVDRMGKCYNTDKSVWFQGRCLWTFSKLLNVYGANESWEKIADSTAQFIKAHCIDGDGRMFFTVTREGKPLRKRRYFYSESFLVVGFAEYYLHTKDRAHLALAEAYFDLMYRLYRDPASDPYKITPKGYAQTRSMHSNAYPMVLVSSAQTLLRADPAREEYYRNIINGIVSDMITLHYKEEYECVLENVAPDGSVIDTPEGRTVNPGHSIENAWFLMNYAHKTGNGTLLSQALNILDWSLKTGWDETYGGVYYFRDAFSRPCEQLEYDMKLWWVHNECLIATLAAYKLTGEEKYFAWFEKIHGYAFSHFEDKEYGEWYGYLHRDGSVSHTQKGSMWKGPYHLPRCLMLSESILQSIAEGTELPELL